MKNPTADEDALYKTNKLEAIAMFRARTHYSLADALSAFGDEKRATAARDVFARLNSRAMRDAAFRDAAFRERYIE